ncbi:hypothetical protein D7223_04115 [Micromonospora endolithica]|uniref:Uncharacterized protein n=1 Tax=Micromonospora endolithica TaxID=230091 RepID=A0A3A9ZSS3_9ACTN|nr:hypothetical protein D7223_04115 [Micromonospora endolithica]
MTRRVATLLLALARRRWPVDLRDDLHREWTAELHVLADRRQRVAMLLFAASLAARRSGVPAADRAPLGRWLLRTALPLLLAPTVCAAVVLAGFVVTDRIVQTMPWRVEWAYDVQLPLASGLVLAVAVGLAILADRLARLGPPGGWAAVVAVMAPLAATVLLIVYALRLDGEFETGMPVLVFWLAALTVVLRGAAALAARGRIRAAWAAGVLGALVVADLTVVLAVLGDVSTGRHTLMPHGDPVDPVSAPLWLFAVWTNSSLGFPRPTDWELFLLTDSVLVLPLFLLAVTPYTLAWVLRAARCRRTGVVGVPALPVR